MSEQTVTISADELAELQATQAKVDKQKAKEKEYSFRYNAVIKLERAAYAAAVADGKIKAITTAQVEREVRSAKKRSA